MLMNLRVSRTRSITGAAAVLAALVLPAAAGAQGATQQVPGTITPPTLSYTTLGVGSVITTSLGTWTNNPTKYAVSWQRCVGAGVDCSPIPGQTTTSYTITAADQGQHIGSVVAASNAAGSLTQPDTSLTKFIPLPGPSSAFTVSQAKAKVTKNSASITSTVTVTDAGTIAQSGVITYTKKSKGEISQSQKTECTATGSTVGAGSVTLTCRMGDSVRKQLKKKSLKVDLITDFTPTGGAQNSSEQTVTLKKTK